AVEHARCDRAFAAGASVTEALSLTDRPQLRRGVRVGTDPLSDETVLLFPEGVLLMNETAAAVVRQCDGSRTVAAVLRSVGEVYDEVAVEDVLALLQDLVAQGLLVAGSG
ncbi:MAG: pyrroloquinoline quinone biosynthesis peptide chaperone PqqD, partial [Pseudonocardiaceae bacterium]